MAQAAQTKNLFKLWSALSANLKRREHQQNISRPRADGQSEVSQTAVYLGLHCIGFMRAQSNVATDDVAMTRTVPPMLETQEAVSAQEWSNIFTSRVSKPEPRSGADLPTSLLH